MTSVNNSIQPNPIINPNQPNKITCQQCLQLTSAAKDLDRQGFLTVNQKSSSPANMQAIFQGLLKMFNLVQL